MEAFVATAAGLFPLSSQHYAPNVVQPNGDKFLQEFRDDPWPTWIFRLPDGTGVRQEIFSFHGAAASVLKWTLMQPATGPASLKLRLLLSGRDYHALHHENPAFRFHHQATGDVLRWSPYPGVPEIIAATYAYEPLWYRQFLYAREEERGLDCLEDLASPGTFRFDLTQAPAVCILTCSGASALPIDPHATALELAQKLEAGERVRRSRFPTRLHRSADQFLAKHGAGLTIIAGYPWFTDWGRDTFISLRGLCLATGWLDAALDILRTWAGAVSEGMVPNRFPDQGTTPEYNSVDASLWFAIAVYEFRQAVQSAARKLSTADNELLQQAVQAILQGYAAGTRHGIRAADDGLLRAGEPGVQLTWMDAKAGDWVVTPRIGKPVEVQALWINALWMARDSAPRWGELFDRALASFRRRFWNPHQRCLYDVIDADHVPGRMDDSLRANQIFAVGGLPLALLEGDQARQVVDIVEQHLLTPLGLRTLDPSDPAYCPHYQGGVLARDGAYHQGTVWPWLLGPFVEAWVRVRGSGDETKQAARERFLPPLRQHLQAAGLGHISEIADAEPTATAEGLVQLPRGCPCQAWSLGEYLRLAEQALKTEINQLAVAPSSSASA